MLKKVLSVVLVLAVAVLSAPLVSFQPAFAAYWAGILIYQEINNNTEIEIVRCVASANGILEMPAEINGLPVTSIEDSAFEDCDLLTSITIPDSVTSIGICAFCSCNLLTGINVDAANQNYSSIDGVLFNKNATELICYPGGKSGLYIIPDSVISIGNYAFYNCDSIAGTTIPDSVTSIGCFAFYNCTSLIGITIPDSVTIIGSSAFCNCTLLTSITLPDSVTSIGVDAFWGCNLLTGINVDTENQNYSSIDGIVFNKNATELILCPQGKSGSYAIPDSVTSIGSWAFYSCDSLTGVTIENSVTSIGSYAFCKCDSLTIYCYEGSTAQQYAIDNGIQYVIIETGAELELYPDSSLEINAESDTLTAYTAKLTASYVVAQFTNENVVICDKDGTQLDDNDYVGTGCAVRLMDGDSELDALTVVIKGDVDGNGLVDVTDARTTLRVAVGLENFNDNPAAAYAADVTGTDGKTDVNDARTILRVAVGLETF